MTLSSPDIWADKRRVVPLTATADDSTVAGASADAPRRPLWRQVAVPPHRDIRQLRPPSLPKGERFESFADAARIDRKNIARLMARRPDLAAAIEKYEIEL